MPYPLLCWWHHIAFFNVVQQTPNPTGIDWFKARHIKRLTSDLSLVSDWGRAILVLLNALKAQFLLLYTQHNLPDNYIRFFNDTQLPLSFTLNTLGLFFFEKSKLAISISTLAKSASKKLSVLWRLCPFFSSSQLLALYRGLIRPYMEHGSHVWGGEGVNSHSLMKQGGV